MKTVKKFLAVFIAILMLTAVVPISAFAQDVSTESFLTYEVKNGEATITGCNNGVDNPYLSSDNYFDIPECIDGYTVTAIGEDAFRDMNFGEYCTIVIPKSVERIEARAFYGCTGASRIHITDGVNWIGDSAFVYAEITHYDFGFTAGEKQLYTGINIFGSELAPRFFCCLNNYSAWKNYYYPGDGSDIPLSNLVFCDLYNYSILYDYQIISDAGDEAISLLRSYDFSTNEIPETIDGLPVAALGVAYDEMQPFYGNVGIKDSSLSSELIIPKSIKYIFNSAFPSGITNYFKDISYRGTEEEWNKIGIERNNDGLSQLRIHYNYDGHAHKFTSITDPSTCIENGASYKLCSVCNEKYEYTALPKSAHTYGDWEITVQPTTQAAGTKERTCTVCSVKQTASVPKLDAEQLRPTVNEDAPLMIDNEKSLVYGFDLTKGADESVAKTLGLKEGTHLAYDNVSKPRTGDKIEIRTDGSDEVIASYTAVVFGDINGDGIYDGADATVADMIANNMTTPNEAELAAADCNHDGVVNQEDVELLNYAGVLLSKVDQTKTQEELNTDAAYNEYISFISQDPDKPGGEIKPDNKPDKEDNAFVKFFKMIWNFIKSLFKIKK